ncbi:beta/gamma crystallin domain-containing protein 1 [Channa argus]|uniref:beta/gamma crystallin domain-containing protein 1 n=1 Tax=Channa argus TaxID=215402 RepID=UPI002946A102|nr:hypothetical protein Q8A73_000380 [Channa argus]
MAKKSSSRNALKSLFSRSEAHLEESVDKDVEKAEGEKKKFKFLKFKTKSKKGSASEKSANESRQVLSAVETSNAAETDGEAWADKIVVKNKDQKSSFLYATAPRSKSKEFSYSELDLRKPKRFATFSFGLRKRKKKDEEDISKSFVGLHSPGIKEIEEAPLDLRPMELDQANTKTVFSMSQPQLDTCTKYDIPSPPPVASNRSDSYIDLPGPSHSSVPTKTPTQVTEPLRNSSVRFVAHYGARAPIASIPELQLDEDDTLNIPAQDKSSSPAPKSATETTRAVTQTASSLPASRPTIALETSDHDAALVDSAFTSTVPYNDDILQQSDTKTEIYQTESTAVTLSHHHPDASGIVDSAAGSGEPFLTGVGSKTDTAFTESPPVSHNDKSAVKADSASIHQEFSVSTTEKFIPETIKSVSVTSAVSSEKRSRPVIQDAVYGELYESLFPSSFTSEVMSSSSNPPPKIYTVKHVDVKSEPFMIKTRNELHTETNVIYSRLSTSHELAACSMDGADSRYTDRRDHVSEGKKVSSSESSRFTPYQSSTPTVLQTDPDNRHEYLLPSLSSASEPVRQDIHYSELSLSHSEVKSDSFVPIHENVRSVPVVKNSAPPVSDCVTSQGTESQITDSKRRVILVKELVTNETDMDPVCPPARSDNTSAVKDLVVKIKTTESFSEQMGGYDGLLSPAYLSVGSDDGSAMDIYYSAEEDNAEASEVEEMYTVDEREDKVVEDGLKEFRLREEQGEIVEDRQAGKKHEADLNVAIIKMQDEDGNVGNEEKTEDVNLQTEVQQHLRGPRAEGHVLESKDDEEMYTLDKREGNCVVDGVKEVQPNQGQGEIVERRTGIKNEGKLKVVIIKTRNEDGKVGNEEKTEDVQTKVQRTECQVHKTAGSEFLLSNHANAREEAAVTAALPERKEEGEEGKREELLATPVQQVNTLMECNVAPPSSEPRGQGEGSEGKWTKQLETEAHPNGEVQFQSQELQYLAHKDIKSPECVHAASSHSRHEDVITPTSSEADKQVSVNAHKRREVSKESVETASDTKTTVVSDASAETQVETQVVTGVLTQSAELQSDALENWAPLRSEGVDTITQSTDRNSTVQEQVSVKLSVSITDTHHPDTEAAERHEHPPEARPGLNQGSLTASSITTADTEVLASGSQQTKAEEELVDKMNAGYSSLSSKLSIKNMSPPKDDESKHRVHKVSLINEAKPTYDSQDTLDFSKTSTMVSNGTDVTPEYKWKNNFERVSLYKSSTGEDISFSDSYRVSDTYSSTSSMSSSLSSFSSLPEAPGYKCLSNSFSSASPSPEEHFGNRLSDRTEVCLSPNSEPVGEPRDEWRRSLLGQEELSAPAGEREEQREAEAEEIRSHWLPVSEFSSALQSSHTDGFKEDDDNTLPFTGLFKATFVELVSDPPASPTTPPASPVADSSSQFDMDTLMDTLKNMGPSFRPRNSGPRAPPPVLVSSLPPIIEDAPNPVSCIDVTDSLKSATNKTESTGTPAESSLSRIYTLPADLGLRSVRDTRSPLELMKQSQQDQPQQSGTRGLTLPLRESIASSIVMRKSSDSPTEELKSPVLNGNGLLPSSSTGSRLEKSVLFRNYRSSSIEPTQENGKTNRPLFHTNSLPEMGPSNNRMSATPKELYELSTGTDQAGSRFERLSFLLNPSSSTSTSLTGAEDPNARMSRPSSLCISSPTSSNSPTRLLSPTGSIDLHRPFTTSDLHLSMLGQNQDKGMGVGTGTTGAPILQRSFSGEHTVGVQQPSLFSSMLGGSVMQSQQAEPDRNLTMKYRAFPDAYLTKEKEHGKLNPRPGKMYIFDRPGMCGQRIELRGDVIDATPWELQETISIRVVRGGWVLYEKPNFKGEKFALDEGDIELTNPFNPPDAEVENGPKKADDQNGETRETKRFIIGSVRRAVRDYSVPEICLFPEENAEGKKVIFRDTSDDARIFGFPIKANSIIINAGLWLVFAHPFFQGVPRVLEVGGYSNPAAWGVEQPYVGSLHPLKVGEPRVENMGEPKMVIYDKPYFSGKSRTITTNMRDFMTRTDRQQTVFMYSVGSLKVLGGIWVGYEKEGFRGHQYLLEEGEYHDWRVWGGCDAELRSVRVIRADLRDPLMVMLEQPEEEQGEENSFEVTEAIPDVELFGYKTSTRSIHVISGAWIAYSHVDFSGNQFILEKGFYSNCADWGSRDNRICSVQPVLLAPGDHTRSRNEIILYSEPDFQGECHVFDRTHEAVPEKLTTKSCRVVGGSWVLYENKEYSGNLYVLSEGEYPNLTSMGCPPDCSIRSVKTVPMTFSVPSISLFGLECLEGREITTDTEIVSMVEEGFNNHILSVKVNSGCWVICEHSNYRGRQFLLEPIEITNWPKFSSLHTIGSVYPVRQKRQYFRIKNKDRGHYMSIQGGVEELKTGRVVVTPEVEPTSDIWFYQDGFIKNKFSPTMSLQVMGNVEPGAKVVLWTETRQPLQTWTAQMTGLITSVTFPGMVLDVKGGKTYDKDHVVVMSENEERPSQQWEIELV